MTSTLTIVLVHGALTDASVWSGVAARLHSNGYHTIAPAMPLRGLQSDAEYLSAFLDTLTEPFLLVGHSYGGSILSHPLISKPGLKGLVFVSAFVQDAGETAGELNGKWPGSGLGETTTIVRSYPAGNDMYLQPKHFAEVYAGDLSPQQVQVLASAQRPIDVKALSECFIGTPTWKTVPAYAVLSTEDRSLPPQAQRVMAERANARIVEVKASHASPLSQADAVAAVITQAASDL